MTLRYLLDTNICIYIAKQKPVGVLQHFEKLVVGEMAMSAITYGELLYGVGKSHHPKKARDILEELSNLISPLPLTVKAGEYYGHIRPILEKKGKPIGNNDLWIAAHALALEVVLVTNNSKEFSRIPGLKLANWV
ncbi:MAG: plasmid maintenance protein [Gammaproteobacteria bacterium RIFCSPHIGHO2_12_FULL_41_20]|nr:MAG: plasmid maintenance protein [Gammaproteobacteria bacterium RIFCSPHIGHO2_12_FULL_41_20]